MHILYNIFYCFALIVYVPLIIFRGRWHSGIWTRFGASLQVIRGKMKNEKTVWVHAVSVGEILTIVPLVRRLKEQYKDYNMICSTVTNTGYKIARENFPDDVHVIYAPLDFSWVVKNYIKAVDPVVYIAAETEIWPNLYMALHKLKVPIVQVNGRISDRSFRRYNKLKALMRGVLSCVDKFCMQSRLDAGRIIALGAAETQVEITGNIKFDFDTGIENRSLSDFGLQPEHKVWLAGSTHPGEEDIVLDAYRNLTNEFESLRLIVCPRHVERADDVAEIIKRKGLNAIKYSTFQGLGLSPNDVIVVDKIGHLRALYALASIVFIGKTLRVGGGQNMIEPAFFGKPTIVGPLTQNFKDAVSLFLENGAMIQIKQDAELKQAVSDLLAGPEKAAALGKRAQEVVVQNQGATRKTLEAVGTYLS